MDSIDKNRLLEIIIEKLEAQLETTVESALFAKEASTNEESKAENKYDTRGLEASYLASGQAQRAEKLREKIYHIKKIRPLTFSKEMPIAETALIKVLIDDKQEKYFFLISVGGLEISIDGILIQTLSFDAPLGQLLIGHFVDDEVSFKSHIYEILEIH